jgi:hypothetical protein
MGLFSGSDEYYVSSATFRLIETPADPIGTAVMGAIAGNRSIAEEIINVAFLNGMANKVHSLYKYAQEYYTLGLPGGAVGSISPVADEDVASIIKSELGTALTVLVANNIVLPLTKDVLLLVTLITTHGYDIPTETISIYPVGMTVPTEGKVTLTGVVYVPSPSTSVDLTYAIWEWVEVKLLDTNGYWYYTNQWVQVDTFAETLVLDSSHQIGALYCVAEYTLDGGTSSWWLYNLSTEVYPIFTSKDPADTDGFLPVVPIRFNNASLTDEAHQSSQLYITSKKLLKKIKVDIDFLATNLEANPTIADIDHAYIMFGVDVQTTTDAGISYLVEFFDHLYDISTGQQAFTAALLSDNLPVSNQYHFSQNTPDANGVINLNEKGLVTSVTYDYITSGFTQEVIGPVGKGTRTFSQGTYSDTTRFLIYTLNNAANGTVTFKLQVTPTVCKTVSVHNLVHRNLIYSGHGECVTTSIRSLMEDANNHNLIIPIHYNTVHSMPVLQQNIIYEESLIMVINSVEKVHTDWYESGAFQILLIFVALVLTVLTWGGSSSILAGILANAGAGIALTFVVNLVAALVIGIGISQGLTLISSYVSDDLALAIGVIVTIYKIYSGSFLTGLSAVTDTYTKYEATEMQLELEDMNSDYELLQKELDEAQDLLGMKADYDPLLWIKNAVDSAIRGEKPDSFLMRTSNMGNTSVLKVVENYCDMLLTLPKSNEISFYDIK